MTRRLAFTAGLLALLAAAAPPASAAVPFTTTALPVTSPMGIAAADVDADGTIDLVTANSVDETASVFVGDGTGAFGVLVGTPLGLTGSAPAVAAGDLNHDGRADLVLPDYQVGISTDSDQVEIFLASPSGYAPAAPLTAGMGTSDATIADFNEDSHPDLAISNAVDSTLTVFLGDGTGAFAATPASPLAVPSRELVTGDFDADGHVDIAAMLATGQAAVRILEGDGTGGFSIGAPVPVGTAYNGLAATDFDSDGDLDLVTSGGGMSGTVVALRNDGTGALSTASTTPMPTGPGSIAAADFDADGHPDIALSQTFNGGKAAVLPGDGSGGFGPAVHWATAASPFQIIATDVDSDGRPDLAVTNYSGNQVTVLRNGALPSGALAPGGAQDLGAVTVGQTGTRTFTVSSSGTAALHVGTRTLTGTGFHVAADSCSGKIVPAGGTCAVTVAFTPGTVGAASGELTLPTDDALLSAALTATGVPVAGPEPTPVPPVPTPPPSGGGGGGGGAAPDAGVCVSRRTITITTPKRLRGGKVTITMGKRRIARVARAGAAVKVDMSGLPRGSVRVTLQRGKARQVRTYRTCTVAKRT